MRAVFYPTSRAVLFVLITVAISLRQPGRAEEPNPSRRAATEAASAAAQLSQAFRDAANRASPGLVTVYSMRGPRLTPRWRRRLAARDGPLWAMDDGHPGRTHSRSFTDDQGSGIVIDSKGLILTCNHVVAAADALLVVLPDGRSFEPVEVRGDPVTDVAVIRIEGAGELDEVRLGNSDDVRPGDWAVTLANPFELNGSLSAGVVSATNRWVPGTHHPLIQYDASTNPGSSGGALLNLQGEVIGIITGSFGQSERFQGIGMAVPVDVAKRVVKRLRESGETQHAYLGCQTKALSPAVAKKLGLPVAGGLYVEDVEQGSPAEKAGFKEGDVITHFGEQAVDEWFGREHVFEDRIPGKTYSFTLFRAGKPIDVDVRMGRMPGGNAASENDGEPSPQHSADYFDHRLGLGLDPLSPRVARELGFPEGAEGALVSHVVTGGPAYKEGIAAGMIVKRIDGFAISDVESYKQAASSHSDDMPLLMLIQSNEGKHLVVFEGLAR